MNKQTALDFVDAINAHDVERIAALMAPDYLFIGAYADEVRGAEQMKNSWIGYFSWFPDYRIEVNEVLEDDGRICLFGYAGGTYHGAGAENIWRLPAAWRVLVENGKIKLWQVYCDSKVPYDIMDSDEKEPLRVLFDYGEEEAPAPPAPEPPAAPDPAPKPAPACCPHCGGENIERGVQWNLARENKVGLWFDRPVKNGVAQAYSDLCLDCGTLVRTYIRGETSHKWHKAPFVR